jgi:hypothetical protein
MTYTVESTQDEFGQARWFVADENADWVSGPFDTEEAAREEVQDRQRMSGPTIGCKRYGAEG